MLLTEKNDRISAREERMWCDHSRVNATQLYLWTDRRFSQLSGVRFADNFWPKLHDRLLLPDRTICAFNDNNYCVISDDNVNNCRSFQHGRMVLLNFSLISRASSSLASQRKLSCIRLVSIDRGFLLEISYRCKFSFLLGLLFFYTCAFRARVYLLISRGERDHDLLVTRGSVEDVSCWTKCRDNAFPSRGLSLIIHRCAGIMRNCSPYAPKTARRV